jgi:hypothetical protein
MVAEAGVVEVGVADLAEVEGLAVLEVAVQVVEEQAEAGSYEPSRTRSN